MSQVQILSGMLVVTKIGTADNELPTCCNQRLSGSLLLLLLLVCPRIRAGADVTIMGGWTPPLIAPHVGFNGKGNQGRMKTESDRVDASLGTQSRNSHLKRLSSKIQPKAIITYMRG